jgi:hypothetical protein
MRCPHCGCDKLFGPSEIEWADGTTTHYYDCCRCHTLLVLEADGTLTARAGAW